MSERIPFFAFSFRRACANDATISCPSDPQPIRVEGVSNVSTMAVAMTTARFIQVAPTLEHFQLDAQARRNPPYRTHSLATGTPVLGHAGTYRVGTIAADEPPVLVGDQRSEVYARHAMRTTDD